MSDIVKESLRQIAFDYDGITSDQAAEALKYVEDLEAKVSELTKFIERCLHCDDAFQTAWSRQAKEVLSDE